MRRLITLALLCATYLCLALTVALTLWRNGGGWGAGVAAFVGGLGLFFAFHDLIARKLESSNLLGEVGALREGHKLLLDQMERLDKRVTGIAEAVEVDLGRSEQLEGEVHMLEGLVARLHQRIEEQPRVAANVTQLHPSPPADAPLSPLAAAAGAFKPILRPVDMMDVVRDALTDNRVDLYLQPIVGLPQRRTIYYESFSRLRDASGQVIMPAEYLKVAEPAGLMTAVDNLLLFRCVQIVRRLARQNRRIGIFCNVSMASLGDDVFFPQFLELMAANQDLAGSLIFEIGQAAFQHRTRLEARNMAKLADLGFRFSLDKIEDLDLDFQDMTRADVKYVKIAAQQLLEEVVELDGRMVFRSLPDLAAEDFAKLTARFGIEIIAEKIENERQVVEVLELDISHGQGHLFGEPRAIKDSILAEAGAPAPPSRADRRAAAG
jgi:cyclic-di-GMP phosphodiesterase TipF (flagellum assembly factor)